MRKLIAAMALVASASAQAEFYSGNNIYEFITSDKSTERALALGFIAGVVDVYQDVRICTPPAATLGQMHDITRNYLSANPQIRHKTAESLILEVLSAAYPCRDRGGRSL